MSTQITPLRPVLKFSATPSTKDTPPPANCSALQLGAKLARLRVEHPDAAELIEQLIDDSLYGYGEKGGA